jgi:hypothetical protein
VAAHGPTAHVSGWIAAAAIGCALLPVACRVSGADADGAAAPRTLDQVEPEFLAALESVQLAVEAGEDDTARAILDRVLWRAPTGRTLDVARAFERVLDGRDAVRALDVALVIAPEPAPAAGAAAGRKLSRLALSVRNTGAVRLDLAPGPGLLHVEHERLDGRAAVQTATETKSYEHFATLVLEPGASTEVPLSVFFLELRAGSLAERLVFRFDLRSGTVTRAGRELPAMRFAVTPAEALVLSETLSARGASAPEELLELVDAGRARVDAALDLALRLPAGEREPVLDELARRAARLPATDLEALAPALRWLSQSSAPGNDPELWRAWLARRAHPPVRERARLVLPPRGTSS